MPWYENFFDEWYLRYWIQPITQERTSREVDAIIRFMELTPQSRILDLCCGQGRHSLELARRGYKVTGFDLSDTLLTESKQRAEQEGLTVDFVKGDMRNLPYKAEFDGVFNFYTAFGYFEHDQENQSVIDAVSKVLKPGGRFLLDYPCLEGRMPNWKTQEYFEYEDGTIMLHEMIHDTFNQTIKNNVLYITKDNERHRTGFTLRHYYGRELQTCLKKANLTPISTYANTEGDPLTNRDTRVLLLSQRQ